MKIHRLEAHDRMLELQKKQAKVAQQGVIDCLKVNLFSLAYQDKCHYIYIFGHARLSDDGLKERLLWQPRLTKPKMEPNSYLFRALSKTDNIETCWMLPKQETWGQHKKGNVTENEINSWSIYQYNHKREEMELPFPDDLTDEQAKKVLFEVAREMEEDIRMKKLYNQETKIGF